MATVVLIKKKRTDKNKNHQEITLYLKRAAWQCCRGVSFASRKILK